MHDFEPKTFWSTFSGPTPPALHLFPCDTIRTKTVDAYGRDEHDVPRALPAANPQTGPFYIEGAMPGDTLAVHLTKIRPSRNSATQYREAIDPSILKPGQPQQKVSNWSHTWTLDREKGIATPDNPSDKLKDFSVKLEPMLGCVSVAPFWKSQCGRSASPRGQGRRCRLVIRTARREEVQQNSVRDGRPRDGRRPEDDARGGGATAQQHAAGGGGRGLQHADLGRLEGFAG